MIFDCNECVDYVCIVCEDCKHSESGDCAHCHWCKSSGCADDNRFFNYDDIDEAILSPEDARTKDVSEEFKKIVNEHLVPQTVVNDSLVFFLFF